MRKLTRFALVCASAAVVVGAAVAYFVNTPTALAPEAPQEKGGQTVADESVTLTLIATGDTRTRVLYTCAKGGVVKVCGPESVPGLDVWTRQVTVPAGTTVRVQAEGGLLPSCMITDESDRMRLDHQENGECEEVAE